MSNKSVILYTKDPCPFCVNAKRLLNSKKIAFEEIDLTNQPEEIDRIKRQTGWQTVPIIIINGKLIGGFVDLRALDESGELDQMLHP